MIEIRCELGRAGDQPVGNRFSNMSFWHYLGTTPDERTWHEWAEEKPEGWVKAQYPWLEEMQIFIATGGACMRYPGLPGDTDPCEFDRDLLQLGACIRHAGERIAITMSAFSTMSTTNRGQNSSGT